MALTPSIRVSQADVEGVIFPGGNTLVSQSDVVAIFNVPTDAIDVSQADVGYVADTATDVQVSQADVVVIYLGRVEDPVIRAWTFTLDGHDFYVLRLGDVETLVFDASTEQWVNWDSHGLPIWRVFCGLAWFGGESIGFEFNSNILAGDDQQGILWVLDPEQSYDEAVLSDAPVQQVTFPRIVTGQVPMIGREVAPCNVIFLIGDNFGPLADGFTAAITLEYSDDAGKSYVNAGTIEVTPDTVNQPYQWRSLGQIKAPGRLFRLTDTGVFTRIDSLTMNDPQ